MNQDAWITLAEYSIKYKISQSTLRRRIKGQKAEVRLEGGKYLIADKQLSDHANDVKVSDEEDSPVIASATNLLREIKKAYSLVLQEKQEQILILKDEISNLQMLVQILENENSRLKKEKDLTVPEMKWETELEFD